MRPIVAHRHDPLNDALEIQAVGTRGYQITHEGAFTTVLADFAFQTGELDRYGVNGVTPEALLAVLRDRLDEGPARDHVIKAMEHLSG